MLPDHTTSAGMESSDKKDLERLSISAVVPVMNRHTNHETTSSQAQSAAPLQIGLRLLVDDMAKQVKPRAIVVERRA